MKNKKSFAITLLFTMIFSCNISAISLRKAILYATSFGCASSTLSYGIYKRYSRYDYNTSFIKAFLALSAAILPTVAVSRFLYRKTPTYAIKKAQKLRKEASNQVMFKIMQKYHNNYEELMEKIDSELGEYKNSLMAAYNNLTYIKEKLIGAKNNFNKVKEAILAGDFSDSHRNKIEHDIGDMEDYLDYTKDTICLIKKNPNYLEAVRIESQDEANKRLEDLRFWMAMNYFIRSVK